MELLNIASKNRLFLAPEGHVCIEVDSPKHGLHFGLIDLRHAEKAAGYRWHLHNHTRYLGTNVTKADGTRDVLALHRLIAGKVFHLTENGLDNRECNLSAKKRSWRIIPVSDGIGTPLDIDSKNKILLHTDGYCLIVIESRHGVHYAMIDFEDVEKVATYRWHLHPRKYAATNMLLRDGSTRIVLLQRLILPVREVRYLDHNGLNNRKANLQIRKNFTHVAGAIAISAKAQVNSSGFVEKEIELDEPETQEQQDIQHLLMRADLTDLQYQLLVYWHLAGPFAEPRRRKGLKDFNSASRVTLTKEQMAIELTAAEDCFRRFLASQNIRRVADLL